MTPARRDNVTAPLMTPSARRQRTRKIAPFSRKLTRSFPVMVSLKYHFFIVTAPF
jgi:hypothetical protein